MKGIKLFSTACCIVTGVMLIIIGCSGQSQDQTQGQNPDTGQEQIGDQVPAPNQDQKDGEEAQQLGPH